MNQTGTKRKMSDEEAESKQKYWKDVLSRIIYIVKSFSPDKKNPSDVLTVKSVKDLNESLPGKIQIYGSKRSVPEFHLSFEQYEKLMSFIAEIVMSEIKKELEEAKYFSVSIDSLPDSEQSVIYIRYVNDKGIPVNRFLCLMNKTGNNALQIMDILYAVFDKYCLSHQYFMGLSYDINSNVPDRYIGLKSSLKTINKFADIVPCSSDPLSLVVISAASSCSEVKAYFTTIRRLYKFFLTFRDRWYELKCLIKSLPDTQWSTKNEMRRFLLENWSLMVNALFQISENMGYKHEVRYEAFLLLRSVKRLETCFMTIFWEDISKYITELEGKLHLQVAVDVNFYQILTIYQSLTDFLCDFQTEEKFNYYKVLAVNKSNIIRFNNMFHTEKPQMRFGVNYQDNIDEFKMNTYFSMINQIQSEIEKRKVIYENLALKFNFFNKITETTNEKLKKKYKKLLTIYRDDLTFHFGDECDNLKDIFNKLKRNKHDYPKSIREISTFITHPAYTYYFSNISSVIKMALCIAATDCPAKRQPLSALKKIKTSLGSTTSENTFKSLLVLNFEQEFIKTIDFECYIEEFARIHSTQPL